MQRPKRPPTSNGRPHWVNRPPTVEEALEYSPLSSIVPFGPEPVSVPTIHSSDPSSFFSSPAEHDASIQTLEFLNQEANLAGTQTNLATHTIQGLQELLRPEDLPEYRFKCPASLVLDRPPTGPAEPGEKMSFPGPSLGPFPEMVLTSTNVAFRYPTPITPGGRSTKSISGQRLESASPSKLPKAGWDAADAEPSSIHVQVGGMGTSISIKPQPAIVVPQLPPSSRREEYEVFSSAPSPPSEDDNIRLHGQSKAPDPSVRSTDYRKKSEACLRSLQELIARIFDAEDQLQPDTSERVASHATDYFVPGGWAEGAGYVLSPTIQGELDSLVEKVASYGRFEEVSLDAVIRLQKISEAALRAAEAVDTKLADLLDGDDEVENWVHKADAVHSGLRSAKILLRMVTSGSGEKQVYSEEILQSTLGLLKSVIDSYILPVVELRSSGSATELFKAVSSHKQIILALLTHVIRILQLLVDLLAGEVLAERAVTAIEFLATSLIFVENAHSEKDSILGVRKCEKLRVVAMNVLVQTFSRYPSHRTFIFDEILTSLEKLPVSRQKARQYKLDDGKNIQLVSALIMRLVQTSVVRTDNGRNRDNRGLTRSAGDPTENGTTETFISEMQADGEDEEDLAGLTWSEGPSKKLFDSVQSLMGTAQKNAQYVVHFLVSRALKSTKTGDDPYRVLLDIFTEDFLTVVDSAEWPASELLLRSLLTSMISLADGEKAIAPARNFALDLMGIMGAALSNLVAQLRLVCKSLESSESALDSQLTKLAEEYLGGHSEEGDLLNWTGVYRLVLEYLDGIESQEGTLQIVREFHTIQWAFKQNSVQISPDRESHYTRAGTVDASLSTRLRAMMEEEDELIHHVSGPITATQARLAYALIVLHMPFGKAYERILVILLNSLNSDQATVRSKALKSVIQLIEKDPTILDRGTYVMRYIINRASDPSPLVRDSALGLIGRCLSLKPALEGILLEPILARTVDSQVGVRKRSMKILKDMFLRNARKDVRAAIADAFLHRIGDTDEGVSELATRLLEEIWISPFLSAAGEDRDALQRGLAMRDQVSLIVKTLQRGGNTPTVLGSFLHTILSDKSKNAEANSRVCKDIVAAIFNEIVDTGEQSEHSARQLAMQALTLFAKANAALFRAEQLEHLQVYVEHLSHNDDLLMFRSVVMVFRWVLPQLSNIKAKFLTAIQKALLESLAKLGKRELTEVVPCLWTINEALNTIERLSKVIISCIKGILSAKGADLHKDGQKRLVTTVVRYINIAGLFGRYCDFDKDLSRFQKEFPWWKGDSVLVLLSDVLAPFTNPKQPTCVRVAALDAFGAVCQRSPKLFLREQVVTAFDIVFAEANPELEKLVLTGFKEFLLAEEKQTEKGAAPTGSSEADDQSKRLAVTFTSTQIDGVATAIAQRFLHHAVRIAMATQDAYALLATEIIAVVNRQGLVHPKECIGALVALATSKNTTISKTALREHRMLHQKHETIVEKEYVKAVQQTFEYQKDTIRDVHGATLQPMASKLQPLYEVIKMSKVKSRKKFLGNLCARIDFDPFTLDVNDDVPLHLQYSRFISENLAFFEYSTVDELHHVISCMERIVSSTGTTVAHALETEVFGEVPTHDGQVMSPESEQPQRMTHALRSPRLRQLTAASMVLSLAWDARTYLRRLYGLNGPNQRRETKFKTATKDMNKPPTKVSGVAAQSLWDATEQKMTSLSTAESMVDQCRQFLDLMTVDGELKVAAEHDNEDGGPDIGRAETPSEDESNMTSAPPSGSGKGRKRKAATGKTGGGGARQTGKRRRPSTPVRRGSRAMSAFTSDGELWD